MTNKSLYAHIAVAFAIALLSSATNLPAQLTTADVVGTVTDKNGGALRDASVTIKGLSTNALRRTTTNSAGDFEFTFLAPGQYEISVEASQFKTTIVPVVVAGADRVRADVTLQLGDTTQTIEVSGPVPLLHTDSAVVVATITERAVENLPLQTRNLTGLVAIIPGASEASSIDGLSSGQRPDDRRQTSSFSVNAHDEILNNILIDGTDNNERIIGTIGVKPSIDAIEEVTVQTNNYAPETGRTPGGVVSIITKSGTNQLHGSLYEFFKNEKLNARNPFDEAPFPKAEYHQNDFGGSAGGPILRDRTFFFAAYEGFRQVAGVLNPILSFVPTLVQRELGPQGIIDSDPYIPKGTQVNPIAAQVFQLYPAPNIPGAGPGAPNYLFDPNQAQMSHTGDARIDHRFTSNDLFYSRYTVNNVATSIPNSLPSSRIGGVLISPGSGDYGYSGPARDTAYNLQMNYIHIFTPALLLELKSAYTRINNRSDSPNTGTNAATAVGFPGNVNFGPESLGLPLFDIGGGLAPLGDSRFLPLQALNNTFQYTGALTYAKGKHSIRVGANLIRRQARSVQSANPNGAYTFNFGDEADSLAAFLAGAFTSVGRSNNLFAPDYRSWEPGLYLQDAWKVGRRLTLNYGFRYDVYTPFTEAHNHISNFDLNTDTLLVAGVAGVSRTAGIQTDYSNLAPRAGLALLMAPGLVLRGGFGMSFFPGNFTSNAGLKNPPFTSVFSPNCAPPLAVAIQTAMKLPVSIPCSAVNGQPETLSDGIPIPVPQSINSPNLSLLAEQLNFRSGRVFQFNFIVEKQFGANVIAVGYVGDLGRDLPVVINNINVPNPTGLTPAEILLIKRPPTFGSLPNVGSIGFYESIGFSDYNGLQVTLQRRYSRGLTLTGNYTWSHAIDDTPTLSDEGQQGFGNANPFDLKRIEKGNSDLDLRHRIALGSTYDLPFRGGRAGLQRSLLTDWRVNAIYVWNTGNPFTLTDAFTGLPVNVFDPGVGTAGPDRPMQIAPATLSNRNNDEYFNRDAFVIPPPGVIGNVGRNSLFGPHFVHLDASVFREIRIRESTRLQLRAEFFNVTNTPAYFIANDQNHDSTTNLVPTLQQVQTGTVGLGFGKIVRTNPNYTPRQIQFAMRLVF